MEAGRGSAAPTLEGRRVWLNVDDSDAWALAVVTEHRQGKDKVMLERQSAPKGVKCLTITMSEADFAMLTTVSDDDATAEVDDLVMLDHVHEATMIHTLRRRYARNDIYTAIGPVLLAINPFKAVPACMPPQLDSFSKLDAQDLPPHIYKLAAAAYADLVDEGHAQSILVSGESGAGKTETTKLCIRCLALASHTSGKMAEAALESGLLLEAFGNARTVYNNNSSRFGKWMAIHFDPKGRISACTISSYLLEQSRIVGPPAGERNYHIFYHLLAGASAEERAECRLDKESSHSDYAYTKQGEAVSPGIDDKQAWADVATKLEGLGFTEAQRRGIEGLVATVLMLGDLAFGEDTRSSRGNASASNQPLGVTNRSLLMQAAALLRVEAAALKRTLTTRDVMVAGEVINTHLSANGCTDARDALAKALYLAVFDHLVARLNMFLRAREEQDAAVGSDEDDRYIGLLDIFGFENFDINGFEQLCINFTNEKLQELFMDTLVQREQQEYSREGIKCRHIVYPDNAAQLKLFDAKRARGDPGGIFAMLDEEANVPNGSDSSFVEKLHAAFTSRSELYARPGTGSSAIGKDLGPELSKLQFVVTHYAERVQYTAHLWLEKNRGALPSDLAAVLAASDAPLVAEAFGGKSAAPRMVTRAASNRGLARGQKPQHEQPPASAGAGGGAGGGTGPGKRPTVGAQFRASLRALAATMIQTRQHFVRCLKPNAEKRPGALDGVYLCRQLRYLGVPAVVEINRVGYPIKYTMRDFVGRYRCIAFDQPALIAESLEHRVICQNLLQIAETIVATPGNSTLHSGAATPRTTAAAAVAGGGAVGSWLEGEAPLVQLGVTKVFLKRELLPQLERPRRGARAKAAVCVQKFARRRIGRRVLELVRRHAEAAEAVHELTEKPEEAEAAAKKHAEVAARLDDAEARLDDLVLVWEQSGIRAGVTAITKRCFNQVEELELMLQRGLEQLSAEEQATLALHAALESNSGSKTKEAFLRLKNATAEAKQASIGLTVELQEAIRGTEAAVEKRFAQLMAEWEEALQRQEELREAERQQRCELLELPYRFVSVVVRNGLDTQSTTPKLLTGYTPSMGVTFADDNSVSMLHQGHAGQHRAQAGLRVGDVVLEVEHEPLNGERVATRLTELDKHEYALRVARPRVTVHSHAADAMQLPTGEHSGWIHLVRATTDVRMTALHPSRKCWLVLDKIELTLHEEKVRGGERTVTTLSLSGAALRVAPGAKKGGAAAAKKRAKGGAERNEPGAVNYALIHGNSEENVGFAKKAKLKQNAVMAEMSERGLHVFRVTWPGGEGGVKHQLVCGVPDPAERDIWAAKLERTLRKLAEAAPLKGYLLKRRGRNGGIKLGWNKRWFELLQAREGSDGTKQLPSLKYYEDQKAETPKGVVVLNQDALLLSSNKFSYKDQPHILAVTCKGELDAKPITTILAAGSSAELDKWHAALQRAIRGFRPESEKALAGADKEETALLQKTAAQLHLQLDYLGVKVDKGCDDKRKLVSLLLHQKQLNAIARAATPEARGELMHRIKRDEQRLMARTVDELHALLSYMEVDVPAELTDKERLVALVIKQKNGDAVSKAIAPDLARWYQKSRSRANVEASAHPVADVD